MKRLADDSRTLGKDGISYSFDFRANGYGRGEGSVCIILRLRQEALNSNDTIRARIRGTGVNHVGRSQGISLPDAQAQADLCKRVYENAGLDPLETLFVEAHGTGTIRGDPVEADSIAQSLQSKQRSEPLLVGSVKSNFG
jgi:acyl transferase domain-containing protein